MQNSKTKKGIIILLFLAYVAIVLFITLKPQNGIYLPSFTAERIKTNFEPFIKITEALNKVRMSGLPGGAEASRREVLKYVVTVAFGFFANVAMFIPLGFFLPMMSRKFDKPITMLFSGFFASLLIETSQIGVMMLFFASDRAFDIDDLIANTLGAVVGYFLYRFFRLFFRRKPKIPTAATTPAPSSTSVTHTAKVSPVASVAPAASRVASNPDEPAAHKPTEIPEPKAREDTAPVQTSDRPAKSYR